MTAIKSTAQAIAVPVPKWVWLMLAAALALMWVVTFEAGSLSQAVSSSNMFLHELFHDGRHLLGVPCH